MASGVFQQPICNASDDSDTSAQLNDREAWIKIFRNQATLHLLILFLQEVEFRLRIRKPFQIDRASIQIDGLDVSRGKHLHLKIKTPTQKSCDSAHPFIVKDTICSRKFFGYVSRFQHEDLPAVHL